MYHFTHPDRPLWDSHLEQQGVEILHGQRHATGMIEEMLPLVRHLVTNDTVARLNVTAVFPPQIEPAGRAATPGPGTESTQGLPIDADRITSDFSVYERLTCLYANTNCYHWLKKHHARVPTWKATAELGVPAAMVLYAECLINGVGGPNDLNAAEKLFRQAVQLGLHSALVFLGDFNTTNHNGRPADEIAAFSWFRKAADAGNAHGVYSVGVCYSHGTGTAKSEQEAIKWYRRAAELGSSAAMYRISYAYHRGEGVTPDDRLGNQWLERAANAGCPFSMWALGSNFAHGSHGLSADLKMARQWYLKGVQAGCNNSMFELAQTYKHGKGVEKDHAQAIKYYLMGGETSGCGQNFRWAGELYLYDGPGIARDFASAVRCFEQALLHEPGDTESLIYLGRVYCTGGHGVEADWLKGRRYFENAAANGSDVAKKYLNDQKNRV